VEKLSKDKDALRQALLTWLSYWRDVLLCSSGASASLTNLDLEAEIAELAGRLDLPEAHRMVSALERTLDMLEHNVTPRLATEALMLDLPKRGPTPEIPKEP
jgi:DNA polymerase-3 subunit delta'